MGEFLFGLDPIRALRELSSPVLDAFFVLITQTGSFLFFMTAAVLVYWLWDKRLGLYLSVLLLASGALNGYLKALLDRPRPPAVFQKVGPLTDPSFPSGHAQTSAALWSGLAMVLRRWWIPFGIVLTTLVALSRVYLGVHFVGDVLGGVAIGLGLGVVAFSGFRASFWGRLGLRPKLALAVIFPAAFGGVLVGLGQPAFIVWGLLTGLSVGYVLEGEWVGLRSVTTTEAGVLRTVVGIPVVGGFALLGLRFSNPFLVLPFFSALGFVVTFVLPWIFVTLERFLPRRNN